MEHQLHASLSVGPLARTLFRAQQLALWPIIPPAATTLVLLLGLAKGETIWIVQTLIPAAILVFATAIPWLDARRRASALTQEIRADARRALVAVLELPGRVERTAAATYLSAVLSITLACAVLFALPVARALLVLAMFAPAALLGALRNRIDLEHRLAGVARDLAQQAGDSWVVDAQWRSSLERRLPWLALVSTGTVVVGGTAAFLPLVSSGASPGASELVVPLVIAGWMGLVGAHSFWLLGRRYKAASVALATAGEALLQGQGVGVTWVAADDTGDLARSLARSLSRAMDRSDAVARSAERLAVAAQELAVVTSRQQDILTEQATTLAQTRVAAGIVRDSSVLVAGRSRSLLQGVETALSLASNGEARLADALGALDGVRTDVGGLGGRIESAGTRASRIGSIALEVKELATRSNMLALNAAIEATRAGESARGFGVVAFEMRRLADESINATKAAATSLQEVKLSIDEAAETTRAGVERINHGLATVRLSGDALGDLAGVVRTQSASLTDIANAVTQQASGVEQLFGAIDQLASTMDETVRDLARNGDVIDNVRRVAGELTGSVSPGTP